MSRPPAIVAELGRPETPEETRARKAAASKKHRENQTLFNLIIATVVSLALVLVMILMVVRPAPPPPQPIDYHALADDASATLGTTALAPAVPTNWYANSARLETAVDGTPIWYIGFVLPDNQFLAIRQAASAAPGWLIAETTTNFAGPVTNELFIGGLQWAEYDRREVNDVGNYAYVLTTTGATDSVVLFGTADEAQFRLLAESVAGSLNKP